MADTKISALTALTGANLAKLDEFVVNDVSDTTMAASGTDKKMTSEELANAFAAGNYQPKISAGAEQWVMPGMVLAATAAGTGTANVADTIYYEPMIIDHHCQLDAIGFGCSTLHATSVIRLGVYRADEDWQPTSLVVDAGNVAIDTTGIKSVGSLATALTPGRYLKALWASLSSGAYYLYFMSPRSGAVFSAATLNQSVNRISIGGQTHGTYASTGVAWTTVTASTTQGMQQAVFCQLS